VFGSAHAAYELLHIAGLGSYFTSPAPDPSAVLKVETALASASLSPEQRTDPRKVHHRTTVDELATLAPHVPWSEMLKIQGFDASGPVEVTSLDYVSAIDELIADTPLVELQHYVAWQLIQDEARFLDQAVLDADFSFWGESFGACPGRSRETGFAIWTPPTRSATTSRSHIAVITIVRAPAKKPPSCSVPFAPLCVDASNTTAIIWRYARTA
jgi:hypothetical protein